MDSSAQTLSPPDELVVPFVLGTVRASRSVITGRQWAEIIGQVLDEIKPELPYLKFDKHPDSILTPYELGLERPTEELIRGLDAILWPIPTPKRLRSMHAWRGPWPHLPDGHGSGEWELTRLFLSNDGGWFLARLKFAFVRNLGGGDRFTRLLSGSMEFRETLFPWEDLLAIQGTGTSTPAGVWILTQLQKLLNDGIQTRKLRLRKLVREAERLYELRARLGEHLVDRDRPTWALDEFQIR